MTAGNDRGTRRLLVVTDLDGCLLDENTYSFDQARPALTLLHSRRIPLVLASSKTRAEMAALAGPLGPVAGLIVENGGAIVVPERSPFPPVPGGRTDRDEWLVELGTPRTQLVAALDEIATKLRVPIRGFYTLSVPEIAQLTGLPPELAALAAAREYDEPFLLENETALPDVLAAAEARGLRVTRGGRFHHLTGDTDKGRAWNALLAGAPRRDQAFTTIGLGDSANDRSLLAAVDRPIVVPRSNGVADPLLASLPRAAIAPAAGPKGWNAAVLDILNEPASSARA